MEQKNKDILNFIQQQLDGLNENKTLNNQDVKEILESVKNQIIQTQNKPKNKKDVLEDNQLTLWNYQENENVESDIEQRIIDTEQEVSTNQQEEIKENQIKNDIEESLTSFKQETKKPLIDIAKIKEKINQNNSLSQKPNIVDINIPTQNNVINNIENNNDEGGVDNKQEVKTNIVSTDNQITITENPTPQFEKETILLDNIELNLGDGLLEEINIFENKNQNEELTHFEKTLIDVNKVVDNTETITREMFLNPKQEEELEEIIENFYQTQTEIQNIKNDENWVKKEQSTKKFTNIKEEIIDNIKQETKEFVEENVKQLSLQEKIKILLTNQIIINKYFSNSKMLDELYELSNKIFITNQYQEVIKELNNLTLLDKQSFFLNQLSDLKNTYKEISRIEKEDKITITLDVSTFYEVDKEKQKILKQNNKVTQGLIKEYEKQIKKNLSLIEQLKNKKDVDFYFIYKVLSSLNTSKLLELKIKENAKDILKDVDLKQIQKEIKECQKKQIIIEKDIAKIEKLTKKGLNKEIKKELEKMSQENPELLKEFSKSFEEYQTKLNSLEYNNKAEFLIDFFKQQTNNLSFNNQELEILTDKTLQKEEQILQQTKELKEQQKKSNNKTPSFSM